MYSMIQSRRSNPQALGVCGLLGLGDASSALLGSGISAGVSLASSAVNTWLNQINLAHDADTATTQIVNGLAPLLQTNVNAYLAGPRTCADQAAAESAYLTAVQWLFSVAGCGNGAYGSAGNRCISDRFGPGGATDTNAKYPWASYYYTPIASDPQAASCAAQLVASNPDAAEQSAIQNIVNVTSGSTAQTTPGLYASSSTTTGATTGSAAATASSLLGGSVAIGGMSVPTEYLLFGGLGLVVLFIAMR